MAGATLFHTKDINLNELRVVHFHLYSYSASKKKLIICKSNTTKRNDSFQAQFFDQVWFPIVCKICIVHCKEEAPILFVNNQMEFPISLFILQDQNFKKKKY